MTWFISHNSADKPVARTLATLFLAEKLDVWLDEWRILPGDSIVHSINVGLEQASGLVVLWSSNAATSGWVDRELSGAVMRSTKDRTFRIIPVLLDDTPLPPLISSLAYVDWRQGHAAAMVALLRGTGKKDAGRRTILRGLNELLADLEVKEVEYFGIVACPKCGGEDFDRSMSEDELRGDTYLGIKCKDCGWFDSTEVF